MVILNVEYKSFIGVFMKNNKKEISFKVFLKRYFISYAVVPIIVIVLLILAFVILFQFYFIKNEIIINNTNTVLSLNEELNIIQDFLISIRESDEVIDYFDNKKNLTTTYSEFYEVNKMSIMDIVLTFYDLDGEILGTSLKPAKNSKKTGFSLLTDRINLSATKIVCESSNIKYINGKTSVYSMSVAIMNGEQCVGYAIIEFLEDSFNDILSNKMRFVNIAIDKYDRIICLQNSELYKRMEKLEFSEVYQIQLKMQDDYYYISKKLPDYDITIFTAGLTSSFNNTYFMIILFSFIILLVVVILMNNISARVSKRISMPIRDLIFAVEDLKTGNLSHKVRTDSIREFQILSNEYNDMIDKLNEQIEKNKELTRISAEAEFKQLEAQFEPHFLLNMLEMLRYVAITDQDKIEKMILSLSRILRYSLYGSEKTSVIKNDIEHIKDYLYLNQIRIGEEFTYSINCDDEISENKIPKLLIQPLIENSIKHGYQGMGKFHIDINIKKIEKDIFITVADNGVGAYDEKIEDIFNMLYDNNQNEIKHIGLLNIHRRLEIMYGKGYGIILIDDSDGFKITIKLKEVL